MVTHLRRKRKHLLPKIRTPELRRCRLRLCAAPRSARRARKAARMRVRLRSHSGRRHDA